MGRAFRSPQRARVLMENSIPRRLRPLRGGHSWKSWLNTREACSSPSQRHHRIACDQPEENGGFDEGMTPPELLLASLGSCAGFYAAQYLRKHHLATEGTMVRVSAEMAQNPARLNNFRVQVEGSAGNQRPAPPRAGLAAVLNAVRVAFPPRFLTDF